MSTTERLLAKVEITEGCWTWTAYTNPRGYGRVMLGGKVRQAHRAVYEALVGPIPEGLDLDHLCRNPSCVNPDHLEPVTRWENTLRGVGITARRARATHCKRGHEFTPDNTNLKRSGRGRECRTCKKAANAARSWP